MTKDARAYNGVKTVSSISNVGRIGLIHAKLDHHLISYTRINSEWIKDLNISHDTIKVLEENIGSKISDISSSSIFADMSPWVREMKQMGLHQIKKLLRS